MSRQTQRRDSLADSSDSSFDSNEKLSDLEESEFPQDSTDKKRKKLWVMRSGPSRPTSDSQAYAPVAGDDQADTAQPPADDYGDEDYQDDAYSTAEKGRKKSSAALDPPQDYSDASMDEQDQVHDDGVPRDGDGAEKKRGNKKIWIFVGIGAIVLLLILLAIYFFWLRSKPDDDDKSSSSSSSSSVTPASAVNASSASSAIPPSASKPITTVPTSNQTVPSSSLDLSPTSATPVSNLTLVATSRQQKPTSTSTAQDSTTTFFGQITWFNDDDVTTPCGSNPNDGDYIVRVSEELYGDSKSVSSLCRKWISLYQLETDSYTKATIEGICTSCTGNNLDLARATFWALTQSMKLGTTLVQWWWTPQEDRPQNTLKSQVPEVPQATAAGGGERPKVVPTEGVSSNSSSNKSTDGSGFEPVDAGDGFESVVDDGPSATKGSTPEVRPSDLST
ncbi:hypothetical protein JCM16303_000384 [Sporobolomyces ruberrimus]